MNEAGASPFSAIQTGSTLEGTPGGVRDLRYYQLGPNVIQVQWVAPDQPNGQISGYELTYKLMSK